MQMLRNKNTLANETHSIKDFIYSAWEQMQKCLTNKQIFAISVWQKSFDLGVFWIINGAGLHMHLLTGSGFPSGSQGLLQKNTDHVLLLTHSSLTCTANETNNRCWLISSIGSAVFYLQEACMIFSGNSRASFQRQWQRWSSFWLRNQANGFMLTISNGKH